MPRGKTRELHFAGYDFTSGPGGTVVHRPEPRLGTFNIGDCVEYRDVNLWDRGTVEWVEKQFVGVSWAYSAANPIGRRVVSKEWAPNLRACRRG